MNTLYKKRLNFFPEFFYIDIISNKNDNMHFIKMVEIFSRNFFLSCVINYKNGNTLYKKAENFSRNLFEELFEVESKQKPASGGGGYIGGG